MNSYVKVFGLAQQFVSFLVIVYLPVDVDEGLAVHAVNVEDPIQVVHLMLEDTS